jgi:hypothetical protein
MLAAYSPYSSTEKKEKGHSSETSANLYRIVRFHNPKDSVLHSHHTENLKPKIFSYFQSYVIALDLIVFE